MPGESGHVPATRVRSVYVHAPFCVRRCFYCDFAVHVRKTGDADAWCEALHGEVRALEAEGLFELDDTLSTLYVGGGTPTILGPEAMSRLARVIGEHRLADGDLEWTAEANPESLDLELADAWRAAGVNRLSLGVQTFHEDALRWMGRMHGAEGAQTAVDAARSAGFDNVSLDLIFGLPPHLNRSWRADLERVLELDVPHISLYGLTVEPATPLGRAVQEKKEAPVDEQQYRDEFLLAAEMLTAEGYEHYEVSNFARDGLSSRHNAAYWDGRPYLGLGNGAHSFADPLRRWNVREWTSYHERAVAGHVPERNREVVDGDKRRLESIWLGLRTREGLSLSDFTPGQVRLSEGWISQGWATRSDASLRLTTEGWLLLDRLAVELDEAAVG